MALATRSLRSQAAVAGSRKRFSERRTFTGAAVKWTREQGHLLTLKKNPLQSNSFQNPGQVNTLGEVIVTGSNGFNLSLGDDITALGVERAVDITSLSVREAIAAVNAPNANGEAYWRAGLGDVRPGAAAAGHLDNTGTNNQNAMLGFDDEAYLPIQNAGSVAKMYLAAGVREANRGTGADLPGYLDTDYDYPKDPAAKPADVGRGGGINASAGEDILAQRASKFTTRRLSAAERNPADMRFETVVHTITQEALTTAGTNNIFSILEIDGNVVWSTSVAKGTSIIEVPDVVCRGPAFLEVVGDAGGAFQAGNMGMYGDIRLA